MTRREKLSFLVYGAAIVATALFGVAVILGGCGGATAGEQAALSQHSASCEAKLATLVLQAQSCTEAEIRALLLVRSDPDCALIYGDAGIDVCVSVGKDAGHGDH